MVLAIIISNYNIGKGQVFVFQIRFVPLLHSEVFKKAWRVGRIFVSQYAVT